MKSLRDENIAKFFTLVIEEVKHLNPGVIKVLRSIGHFARIWVSFAPEFANR